MVSESDTAEQGPLAGLRVLDFTAAMAGPTATMMLGDFGAEVLKIEPLSGESSRSWGIGRYGDSGEFSGLYLALNRNKRSLTVDLKSSEGAALVRRLLEETDVVVENFKPGVAQRLGIDYEAVRAVSDRIVYCSISGFGQDGPMREYPGFDNLLQAYAGHLSVTGEEGRASVRIGPSAIDLLSGAHAAYGIVVALHERDRSGRGQYVDTSLYDSAIHLVSNYIAEFTGTQVRPRKTGPYFGFLAPYGIYEASDREWYLGIPGDTAFKKFCEAIGRGDLVADARYDNNANRIRNQGALNDELVPLFRTQRAQFWIDLCVDLAIPTSLVHGLDEVIEQEQILARNMLVPAGVDGVRTAGLPIKLSRTPGSIRRFPPRLGEGNTDFLSTDAPASSESPRE